MAVYKEHNYQKRFNACSSIDQTWVSPGNLGSSEYMFCKKHNLRVGTCIYNVNKKCVLCCNEIKWNDTENLKILSSKNETKRKRN